jgi:hypothetical protein
MLNTYSLLYSSYVDINTVMYVALSMVRDFSYVDCVVL